MTQKTIWPNIEDEALVDRLIPAVQQAIAETVGVEVADGIGIPAPDVANVLLMVLASILEPSPAAATPMAMRLLSEAAGKELLALMKDTRLLKAALVEEPGSLV